MERTVHSLISKYGGFKKKTKRNKEKSRKFKGLSAHYQWKVKGCDVLSAAILMSHHYKEIYTHLTRVTHWW